MAPRSKDVTSAAAAVAGEVDGAPLVVLPTAEVAAGALRPMQAGVVVMLEMVSAVVVQRVAADLAVGWLLRHDCTRVVILNPMCVGSLADICRGVDVYDACNESISASQR
eukprot:m.196110 g.196110  ORF g.196110 m.196110 type:complete len:110 (+) comp25049_c1_seq1:863-1192(+)